MTSFAFFTNEEHYLSSSRGYTYCNMCRGVRMKCGWKVFDFFTRTCLFRACNRLTERLKYLAAVQVMDLSNRDDSDPVRYSAAYPTCAERRE